MEKLNLLKLPYEAHVYTNRKLIESSQMLLPIKADDLERALTTKRVAPLKVDTDSNEIAIAKDVESYRKLLELVAEIAAFNPQYQLFFRGQNNAWNNGELEKSVYSGIWRNDPSDEDLKDRLATLNNMSSALVEAYANYYAKVPSAKVYLNRLRRNPLARWALLQHYGVCETPLLDVTRNLQVACTFARQGAMHGHGYVYVMALPYQREAITIDDVQGMTVMSLLGVTPSNARRPLNQDGFLTSTSEWWRYAASESKLDAPVASDRPDYFQRVATVFRIPTDEGFYADSGLSDLGNDWLCPRQDEFADMLKGSGLTPKFW